MEAVLRGDAVDAVDGVEVLDDDHLEAGGAALAGSDDGPREEELPDLGCVSIVLELRAFGNGREKTHPEPALAVLLLDLVGVADPVAVPPPEGTRVVNTDSVDAANN